MTQNRVFIVEDEGLIAADIAASVARIGHAVTAIAGSGEEAMALLEQRTTCKLPDGTLLKKPDGAHLQVEGQSEPRLVKGEIAGATITLRDISERVREARFRRDAQKKFAMAQLASGVAGEFEGHLTAIRKHGQALAASVTTAADIERVRALLSSANRASAITERLLTLSDGPVKLAGSVHGNEAILSLVELLAPRIEVTVRDSGSGLTRDAQDHLFEPYLTTKHPGDGDGLALSLVHAIVTGAGGSIVASSNPGMGACFDIYLPAMENLPRLGSSAHPDMSETEILHSQATRSWTKAEDLLPMHASGSTRLREDGSTSL